MIKPRFVHGLNRLDLLREAWPEGCALTIGSFDGVHRGHQVLIERLKDSANQLGLPAVVMVFEPQPYEFFSREKAPPRLTRLREKVERLLAQGVDSVVCLKFNAAFRGLSAQEFIARVLYQGIRVKYLVIGDDFRFGCDRAGDYTMLEKAGSQLGFQVTDTGTQREGGDRISSTRIRLLLEQNRFEEAGLLLGDEYQVRGRIIYGKQLGRQLGFRTANIGLGRYRSPVEGVFAVTITLSGVEYKAVANVGVRPTVSGGEKPLLEVHILNFESEIYGQWAEVRFKKKIRDEMQFKSLDDLQTQIGLDITSAKEFFNSNF